MELVFIITKIKAEFLQKTSISTVDTLGLHTNSCG